MKERKKTYVNEVYRLSRDFFLFAQTFDERQDDIFVDACRIIDDEVDYPKHVSV